MSDMETLVSNPFLNPLLILALGLGGAFLLGLLGNKQRPASYSYNFV